MKEKIAAVIRELEARGERRTANEWRALCKLRTALELLSGETLEAAARAKGESKP